MFDYVVKHGAYAENIWYSELHPEITHFDGFIDDFGKEHIYTEHQKEILGYSASDESLKIETKPQ